MPHVIVTPRADADIVAILNYLTRTAGAASPPSTPMR